MHYPILSIVLRAVGVISVSDTVAYKKSNDLEEYGIVLGISKNNKVKLRRLYAPAAAGIVAPAAAPDELVIGISSDTVTVRTASITRRVVCFDFTTYNRIKNRSVGVLEDTYFYRRVYNSDTGRVSDNNYV